MDLPPVTAFGVNHLISSICENVETPAAAGNDAVVRVEVSGNPKQVQKAIKQLARQGVKAKVTGKTEKPAEKAPSAPAKPKADDKKDAMESMIEDLLNEDDE